MKLERNNITKRVSDADDSFIYIFGSCIKTAIKDYKYYSSLDLSKIKDTSWKKYRVRQSHNLLHSAKDYLFNPDSLEFQLRYFNFNIDIDAIRLRAEPNMSKWKWGTDV